jgi:hypothetical protein
VRYLDIPAPTFAPLDQTGTRPDPFVAAVRLFEREAEADGWDMLPTLATLHRQTAIVGAGAESVDLVVTTLEVPDLLWTGAGSVRGLVRLVAQTLHRNGPAHPWLAPPAAPVGGVWVGYALSVEAWGWPFPHPHLCRHSEQLALRLRRRELTGGSTRGPAVPPVLACPYDLWTERLPRLVVDHPDAVETRVTVAVVCEPGQRTGQRIGRRAGRAVYLERQRGAAAARLRYDSAATPDQAPGRLVAEVAELVAAAEKVARPTANRTALTATREPPHQTPHQTTDDTTEDPR